MSFSDTTSENSIMGAGKSENGKPSGKSIFSNNFPMFHPP